MPVGIQEVDLRESGGSSRVNNDTRELVGSILAISFGVEIIDGFPETGYAHRKVNVASIQSLARPHGGVGVDDQMKLLAVADIEPCTREGEGRSWDLLKAQYFLIEGT